MRIRVSLDGVNFVDAFFYLVVRFLVFLLLIGGFMVSSKKIQLTLLSVAALLLSACGGDDSSTSTTTSSSSSSYSSYSNSLTVTIQPGKSTTMSVPKANFYIVSVKKTSATGSFNVSYVKSNSCLTINQQGAGVDYKSSCNMVAGDGVIVSHDSGLNNNLASTPVTVTITISSI